MSLCQFFFNLVIKLVALEEKRCNVLIPIQCTVPVVVNCRLFILYGCLRTLAWKIPWTEETGGLQSMGSLRVRHNLETSLSLFTFMHWRRKWQLTPMFLPGESQGWGSLMGCCLWDHTDSDTTEVT